MKVYTQNGTYELRTSWDDDVMEVMRFRVDDELDKLSLGRDIPISGRGGRYRVARDLRKLWSRVIVGEEYNKHTHRRWIDVNHDINTALDDDDKWELYAARILFHPRRKAELESMLDALEAGVPMEDVLA